MQNFRNNFKTRKVAFISAFSVCLTVALSEISIEHLKYLRYHIFFTKHYFSYIVCSRPRNKDETVFK